jgi:hypothetical protein
MIAAWISYALVISAALGFAALAAEQLCRMRRHATRWVWVAAMLGPLLMPLVGSVLHPTSAQRSQRVEGATYRVVAESISVPSLDIVRPARELSASVDLDRILLIAWGSASALLILTLATSSWHLRRSIARWTRIAGVDVAVTDSFGPAVFGVVRPGIIVPSWFAALDVETQRTALAHEQAHRTAHDSRLLAGALLLLVLMPWNLPMWWQWRRLRLAMEVDCDARVLRAGHRASTYGAALLRVAGQRSDTPLFAPAMNDSASALEQRLRLLFPTYSVRWTAAAWALPACVVGCTIAMAQVSPLAEQLARPEVRVAAGAGLPWRVDRSLGYALIEAIQDGDLADASALIERGADINRCVLGDGTPLIVAARAGEERLVKLLLELGADVNLGCTGDGNPLIMTALGGRMVIARALVERGADVNGFVLGDETPLINAARVGRLELVQYLIERGADMNLAVPSGNWPGETRSALSEARKWRRTAVVEYLQARGATL